MKAWIKQHSLLAFFILAFAITWICQISALLIAPAGMTLGNEPNFLNWQTLFGGQLDGASVLALLVFSLGFGPFLAAHIVTAVTDGRPGLNELWGRILKWDANLFWYLMVFLLPLLQAGLALGLTALLTAGLGEYSPTLSAAALPGFLIYSLIFTGLAEEPGWRGFALPRLQKRFTAERSSLILGVIWAVWHFPLMIYYNAPAGIFPLVALLSGYTIAAIGWTIVSTWIYNSTRSVLLMILLQVVSNTVSAFIIAGYPTNAALSIIFALLPWVLAIFLSRRRKPENLSKKKRHMI